MSSRKRIPPEWLLADGGWLKPLERAIFDGDEVEAPPPEAASAGGNHVQPSTHHLAAGRTEALNRTERTLVILKSILLIDEPNRSALVLHFLERRDLKDISRMTAVTEAIARARIEYAVGILRSALHDHFARK